MGKSVVPAVMLALLLGLAAPVQSSTITVVLQGDTVELSASVTVNLTTLPRGECSIYESFQEIWRNQLLREGFTKVAGRALEDYFKRSLGLTDARVDDITIEYTLNRGIVVGTIPPDAIVNATGVIVNGSIGDLSS